MKRPEIRTAAEGQPLARVDRPTLLSKLPNVAEALVQPCWEDGVAKGDRCVFVFASSTLVKLLLKIENPPIKLLASGRTYDEAWACLEGLLKAEDIPWEQDAPREDKVTKKRK